MVLRSKEHQQLPGFLQHNEAEEEHTEHLENTWREKALEKEFAQKSFTIPGPKMGWGGRLIIHYDPACQLAAWLMGQLVSVAKGRIKEVGDGAPRAPRCGPEELNSLPRPRTSSSRIQPFEQDGIPPANPSKCPLGGAKGSGGVEGWKQQGEGVGRSAGSASSSRAFGRPPA